MAADHRGHAVEFLRTHAARIDSAPSFAAKQLAKQHVLHSSMAVHRLRTSGITAMLQLAESMPQPDIISLYAPVEDGEPLPINQFRRGVGFIRQQKSLGSTILVACGAGISRSATFALAALKEEENLDLWTALQEIHAKHPYAMPHMALWQSLCDYYGEDLPFTQVMNLVS